MGSFVCAIPIRGAGDLVELDGWFVVGPWIGGLGMRALEPASLLRSERGLGDIERDGLDLTAGSSLLYILLAPTGRGGL